MATFEFSAPEFIDGTKVSVYPRAGESFVPTSIKAEATGTIKDGEVTFKGLDDDAPYWAVAEIEVSEPKPGVASGSRTVTQRRAVAFTAVNRAFLDLPPEIRNDRSHTTAQHIAQTEAAAKKYAEVEQKDPTGVSAAPGEQIQHNTITGARGSRAGREALVGTSSDVDPADDTRTVHSGEEVDPEHLNQRDVEGVPQRSDTLLGQATPLEPPKKSEVKTPKPPSKPRARAKQSSARPRARKPATKAGTSKSGKSAKK